MNAFNDILGGVGKAADVVLLGGAIGKTKRRNKFADYLEAGQYDQAEQLAVRNGEGAYAQLAQKKKAEQIDSTSQFAVGALRALKSEKDPQRRLDRFNTLVPIAQMMGIDPQEISQFASVLDDDGEIDATISALGGDAATEESFGVTPQFIRGADGQVRAVQFGNKGSVRQQDVAGAPIPLELRAEGNDIARERIGLGYYSADPNTKGAQGYATGYGRETGTRAAGAAFDLPKVEQNAQQILSVIDQAVSHPGFNSRYGFQGAYTPAIAGTAGADFETIRNQLQGKAFLQAFDTLKGGGQITEAEGNKATAAISRIFDPKQTPAAARKAYQEFRDIVVKAVGRAEAQAATGNPYGGGQVTPQSGPQPGAIEDGYRFLGGDPADPSNWEPAQ